MPILSPDDEVGDLAAKSSAAIVDAANALIRARVTADGTAYRQAMDEAASVLAEVLMLADLMGRRRMLLLAEQAEGIAKDSRPETARLAALADGPVGRMVEWARGILPTVKFREAVHDVLDRHPELAIGWEKVAAVYRERHGFACAKAMDVRVTERVQEVIAQTVENGGVVNPRKVIRELGDWSQSYADTVYETNVRTAYTAGQFAQMERPAVARVLLGFRFVSALLATTRPNHKDCHGLTAPTNSGLWDRYSPPLGFRCQCALREISIFEAQDKRLLDASGNLITVLPPQFSKAGPDPGFSGMRPDRALASGSLV